MRIVAALVLFALFTQLVSCHSIKRLGRVSPLSDDVAEERINLWPFYYKNGAEVAMLWPFYDQDEQGFALRPLITKDGSDWELLPPIAWWNTESGNWVVIPAYSIDDSLGVFPVFGFGDFNFVGPAWWTSKSGGLFPLAGIGPGFNWVGPVWWDKDDEGNIETRGLFPVYTSGEHFNNVGLVLWGKDTKGDFFSIFPIYGRVHLTGGKRFTWAGPAWWADDEAGKLESWGLFPLAATFQDFHQVGPVFWEDYENGETRYLVALPFFGYGNREDGGGMMLSLLGGKGWSANDESEWLNVLGPVYHYTRDGTSEATHVIWPLVHWGDSETEESWGLWPLAGKTKEKGNDEGNRYNTWALAGLIEASGEDQMDSLRVAPLFSHMSEDAGGSDFFDWLTLYGYRRHGEDKSDLHLGTPLLFGYHKDGEAREWSAILNILDYESDGTDSSFDLLWYLYRQRTIGTETRRDFFPFVSWDSGEDSSDFSFLWRLFHWETNGDRTGGHFLFIPWGER